MAGSPIKRARRERLATLLGDPATAGDIARYVAEGGSLVTWCHERDVPYSDVAAWLAAEDGRREQYAAARALRDEYLSEVVVRNLHDFATVDIADAFIKTGKNKGRLKALKDMPAALRRAIVSIETGKLKLISPKDAVELLAKYRRMLVDRVDVEGRMRLEDLVGGSMPRSPKE